MSIEELFLFFCIISIPAILDHYRASLPSGEAACLWATSANLSSSSYRDRGTCRVLNYFYLSKDYITLNTVFFFARGSRKPSPIHAEQAGCSTPWSAPEAAHQPGGCRPGGKGWSATCPQPDSSPAIDVCPHPGCSLSTAQAIANPHLDHPNTACEATFLVSLLCPCRADVLPGPPWPCGARPRPHWTADSWVPGEQGTQRVTQAPSMYVFP